MPEIGYKDTPVKSILEIRKLMRIKEFIIEQSLSFVELIING
ncbi:hypothetical protein [Macrococcus armenti]|nr:hypothetical protein [Macrococcus armenti]